MERIQPEKTPEARIAELERLVTRLRIGLILIASVIGWQGMEALGWLGPVRVYASAVYAQEFVLEDEAQRVFGRWRLAQEGAPARLMVFGSGSRHTVISADGVTQEEDHTLPDAVP